MTMTGTSTIFRLTEFLLLFFGIPLLIYMDKAFIHPSIMILPVLVFIFFILRKTTDFTFIGGVYLAGIYWQTRSVLFTTLLHGVLGIMVFGVGLGQYFWLDIPLNT